MEKEQEQVKNVTVMHTVRTHLSQLQTKASSLVWLYLTFVRSPLPSSKFALMSRTAFKPSVLLPHSAECC